MIKWGFYWKLLKQSFIILLISCFTLLVNSSVNAYECNGVPSSWNVHWDCWDFEFWEWLSLWEAMKWTVIDWNFNFDWNVFNNYWYYSNTFHKWSNFWWSSEGLKYAQCNLRGASCVNWIIQGFFVCSSRPSTILKNDGSCVYKEWFSELWLFLNWVDRYSYNLHNTATSSYWVICLYKLNDINYVCIDNVSYKTSSSWYPSEDIILSEAINNPFSNNSSRPWTSFIPSTGSRLWWRLITSSWYTNSQMVEAYECLGLHPSLCYWWFPITNIFQPWEQFEDFTWYIAGEWASVFDLYNLYSGSFSSLNQFLNTVLTRYQNWQINSFITEPKALLMLGSQMNVAWLKTSYISTYCDLLLNKNNDSIYTWNSVDDLRARSCVRSQKINDSLTNSEWDDIVWQGSNVWIFGSGDDVDFDPETFFSNILWRVESWLDKISVWTAVGIVPWYIILFTLALIFIRMISH